LRPILVSIAVIVASIEVTAFDHLIERPVTDSAAYRERYPSVEVTVRHMNPHGQAEALLDGSIMLGIGYVDAGIDEADQRIFTRSTDGPDWVRFPPPP
jgi:hypothetical protein